MHLFVACIVLFAWLIAIGCTIVAIWMAVPSLAGVSGAFGPFIGSVIVGLASLWVAYALTDHEQPSEVRALKAAEGALRTRREEAREKKKAADSDGQAAAQLEARRRKLEDDLQWERIQNDLVAKAKFESDRSAENAQKRQQALDADNRRIAVQCDRQLETWPDRPLSSPCNAPEVRLLMTIAPQKQAGLAREATTQRQEQLDRADAQRCDVYFQNWPNGHAWPRCSASEVQRFMHSRPAAPSPSTSGSSN
jgi:hypothetical protein